MVVRSSRFPLASSLDLCWLRTVTPSDILVLLWAALLTIALAGCSDDSIGPPTGSNRGALRVTTVTTGDTLDLDGYTVMLDEAVSGTLTSEDSRTYVELAPGEHTVALSDVQVNCEVGAESRRVVSVVAGDTARVRFELTCAAALFDKIAFVGYSDSRGIYVMNTDGSDPVRVTEDTAAYYGYPAWSPDATQIAFRRRYLVAENRLGPGDVYVINVDGSNLRQLTQDVGAEVCSWSPDGTKIAYASFTDPVQGDSWGDIYVIDADGTNHVNLTPGRLRGFDPAWSPDGSQIAFASERDGGLDIWVMGADGSNPVNLTNSPVGDEAYEPAWSSDGSRIALVGPGEPCCGIWVMNADGSSLIKLVEGYTWRPTWSPDRAKIAYYDSGGSGYEVFVMEADGSNSVSLTYPEYGWDPAWSPSRH